MELKCALTQDLIPLYLEDLCTAETRQYVEDHLAVCPACREALRRMGSPLPTPPTQPADAPDLENSDHPTENTFPSEWPDPDGRENAPPTAKLKESSISHTASRPLNAKKILRRIRRRWFLTLLALLLLIPAGMLSANEIRGQGISYSTIPQLITARRFIQAAADWDAETGFSLVDLEYNYQQDFQSILSVYRSFSQHPMSSLRPISLGERTYYVSEQIYQEQGSTDTGQDTSALLTSAVLQCANPSLGYYLILAPQEFDLLTEYWADRETLFSDEAKRIEAFLDSMQPIEIGGQFYYSNTPVSSNPFFLDITYELLPAECYQIAEETLRAEIDRLSDYAQQCEAVDYETYAQKSKTTFSQAWTKLKDEGWQLTDWRLVGSDLLRDQCFFRYRVTIEIGEETRDLVLNLSTSPNGVLSSNLSDNEGTVESYRSLTSLYYIPYPSPDNPS